MMKFAVIGGLAFLGLLGYIAWSNPSGNISPASNPSKAYLRVWRRPLRPLLTVSPKTVALGQSVRLSVYVRPHAKCSLIYDMPSKYHFPPVVLVGSLKIGERGHVSATWRPMRRGLLTAVVGCSDPIGRYQTDGVDIANTVR